MYKLLWMVIITGWTLKTSILLDTGEIGGKHQETLGSLGVVTGCDPCPIQTANIGQ